MPAAALSHNLLSWMLQTVVIALAAALLPIVFRVRHPRTQLYYCHAALALCLLFPLLEPWRHEGTTRAAARFAALRFGEPPGLWLFAIVAAGIVLQLCWMSGGLWRMRRFRIRATPLYPVPEAMRAAAAVTQADALFCISDDAAGPMMLGWLAPVVLLPAAFLTLDEEAQCGIACHELLHVRRGDWLVTLIEECARSLFWFNPGVWLLLSEARLAREQLVDAESVRLTASREPYIDALLAIARGRTWSDLAPAPSFLRRSHLTQRMQSLLSDAPASGPRVAGSYCSIAAMLGCAVWLSCTLFPLWGQSAVQNQLQRAPSASGGQAAVTSQGTVAPAPAVSLPAPLRPQTQTQSMAPVIDPYEPVTVAVQPVSTAAERSWALLLLARASQGALRHAPGTPSYRFTVSFTASGNVPDQGLGELTETWFTGQKWRWTANLGSFSHTRLRVRGQLLEDHHATVIPMRAHMLRNEIFWAVRWIPDRARLRSARVLWQGKPATCILSSQGPDDASQIQGRAWDEEEFCFDDASGVLFVHSIAPGTYAQFGYGAQHSFHGRPMPDRIEIYVAGAPVLDASFSIADAGESDEASLTPAPEMTATPPPVELGGAFVRALDAPGGDSANASQPVIVHAEIDGGGNVVETELSAAANAALVPAALELIKKMNFGYTGTERQTYFDVRFTPAR